MNPDEETIDYETIHWLEQAEGDVPADDEWLSSSELLRQGGFKIDKRRRDWRLGRWTAKCATSNLLCQLGRHVGGLSAIEVQVLPSGAPHIFLSGTDLVISLSHRAGTALCAVVAADSVLGCDLELVEPRSSSFAADYFTSREQNLLERTRSADDAAAMTALLWSAKESALKALQVGLRADTQSVEVRLEPATLNHISSTAIWSPLSVATSQSPLLCGWWMRDGPWIKTIVGFRPGYPRHLTSRC